MIIKIKINDNNSIEEKVYSVIENFGGNAMTKKNEKNILSYLKKNKKELEELQTSEEDAVLVFDLEEEKYYIEK